ARSRSAADYLQEGRDEALPLDPRGAGTVAGRRAEPGQEGRAHLRRQHGPSRERPPGAGACFGQPPERVRPQLGGCERAEQRALRAVRVEERLTPPQSRLLEPTQLVVLGGIAALV